MILNLIEQDLTNINTWFIASIQASMWIIKWILKWIYRVISHKRCLKISVQHGFLKVGSQARWCTCIIPALRMWTEEDHHVLEAAPGSIERSSPACTAEWGPVSTTPSQKRRKISQLIVFTKKLFFVCLFLANEHLPSGPEF